MFSAAGSSGYTGGFVLDRGQHSVENSTAEHALRGADAFDEMQKVSRSSSGATPAQLARPKAPRIVNMMSMAYSPSSSVACAMPFSRGPARMNPGRHLIGD